MKVEKCIWVIAIVVGCFAFVHAQAGGAALRGQVADPSGAAIPGASVIMTPANGPPIVTQSNGQGTYEFKNLAPGKYTLTVSASGFTLYENDNVTVADQPLRLNVSLNIEVETQKVQVSENAPTVDVNPTNNAGAITISGKELEALPDDPDELESDLQALAGPSAGPNGGQMYIDGFTAGQLPPKSSIREIRINQNPFSSEYDKLGYGRIEIFTKPGTDKFHGQFFVMGNSSALNSNNPFAGQDIPSYYSTQYSGNVGGPLGKSASFFVNAERRNINDLAIVNAQVLDENLNPTNTIENVASPHGRINVGPRLDYAISKNNKITTAWGSSTWHRKGTTRHRTSTLSRLATPRYTDRRSSTKRASNICENGIPRTLSARIRPSTCAAHLAEEATIRERLSITPTITSSRTTHR
jgi:Carboxypeptidase regulatory-like domain